MEYTIHKIDTSDLYQIKSSGRFVIQDALHTMFIWSGDILLLYSLPGMLLPIFMKVYDCIMFVVASILLSITVVIDFLCEVTQINLSASVVYMQHMYCTRFGITDDNFAYWLRDVSSYKVVLLIAAGIWIIKMLISIVWLHCCQFRILEWIWRILTYGKIFRLVCKRN